ncbi:unnamed protein product, partial [Discosporangium mesarthrocarpum]
TTPQVKQHLEDLDTVGVVTVKRNASMLSLGISWTITFDTEVGDLPLLVATSGRLTGSGKAVTVTELQAGSHATLVYDGTGKASTKIFSLGGLVEDALYAFKVVPINAAGSGIPSGATPTVVAREGAAAAQTVASGPALSLGMAGVVYEQQ